MVSEYRLCFTHYQVYENFIGIPIVGVVTSAIKTVCLDVMSLLIKK